MKTGRQDSHAGKEPIGPRSPDEARRVLRDVFGFDDFREGQAEVVGRLLDGRSTLAIFPTGGGKSLCYQLPALLLDGLTVVASPLIALMKDQVDFLVSKGVAAARLDSSLDARGAREVLDGVRSGFIRILYVSPERLGSGRFAATLAGRPIDLLAVDEAHCISEWGHNFRPEYLKIARLATGLRVGRVLALTATATPAVAKSVAEAFAIDDADVVRTSFERRNLEIHATPCASRDRLDRLADRLTTRGGPAIVYVTLQRTAEEVAASLKDRGIDAVAYHAGLGNEKRHAIQEAFMASTTRAVVATIAFGMGIDKADVRAVYHFNLPKGPENYAQEIGRAGRDGQPAYCEVFACAEDVATLENFAFGDTPTAESLSGLLGDVLGRGDDFDVSIPDLSTEHDIRPLVLQTVLTYLELEGVLASTGPFYAEYKVQFQRPLEEILGDFDDRRSDFLRRLFGQARQGRIWQTIDLASAVEAIGEPRDRALKALNYLEERGNVVLQVAGVRQGYRLTGSRPDVDALLESLSDRFRSSEAREIARIREMLDFSLAPGCLTRRLLDYFGEPLGHDCGHCGWCLGDRPAPLPPAPTRELGGFDRDLVRDLRAEGRPALATPRQLARFLCGLSSPATSRAKLSKDGRFGAFADVPFSDVLAFLERSD